MATVARRVHFDPEQVSGSHRPPEAFRQKNRESCLTHIISEPTIDPVQALEIDVLFRKLVIDGLVNQNHNLVVDLVAQHMKLHQELVAIPVPQNAVDRRLLEEAVRKVGLSLDTTAVVDRSFVDALLRGKTDGERLSIFKDQSFTEFAEKAERGKLRDRIK